MRYIFELFLYRAHIGRKLTRKFANRRKFTTDNIKKSVIAYTKAKDYCIRIWLYLSRIHVRILKKSDVKDVD